MKNEPIRHHYIPRFILKNFCFEGNNLIRYFDKNIGKVLIKNTRDVFMEKNLYRDEKNHPDNPTKIEKDFANFEGEAAHIINAKFLNGRAIVLSYQENDLLMLFFALMEFRSKANAEKFASYLTSDSKKFYSKYQSDKDFDDLFKRNLGYLVNCRSLTEVFKHENIDEAFKILMRRDIFSYLGQHIAVVERDSQAEEFVITDTYPTVVTGDTGDGVSLHIYSAFPISPDRVTFMVSKGADGTPHEVLHFRPVLLSPPGSSTENQSFKIRVRKIYEEEVKVINDILIKEARGGIAFKSDVVLL